jgi:hypothetical protein
LPAPLKSLAAGDAGRTDVFSHSNGPPGLVPPRKRLLPAKGTLTHTKSLRISIADAERSFNRCPDRDFHFR